MRPRRWELPTPHAFSSHVVTIFARWLCEPMTSSSPVHVTSPPFGRIAPISCGASRIVRPEDGQAFSAGRLQTRTTCGPFRSHCARFHHWCRRKGVNLVGYHAAN